MKKCLSVLVTMACSMLLYGCNTEVPDLTQEQTALISEYATHVLVKHSEISNRNLLSESELEQGIVDEAEEKQRKEKAEEIARTYLKDEEEVTDDAMADTETDAGESLSAIETSQTIAEFLGEDCFAIDYVEYELCESYPATNEDEFYMAMDATLGNQLCVVKFSVRNVTSEDRMLDVIGKNSKYLLRMADDESVYAQATMLLDDLSSYNGIITGNAAEQMVLVFEVDNTITQLESAELVIKNESGEHVIPIY